MWRTINSNIVHDQKNKERLIESGWRVLVIWECEIRRFSECPQELKELLIKDTIVRAEKKSKNY